MAKVEFKHEHQPGVPCACCELGIEATEKWEAESLEKYGWYTHAVGDAPTLTGFNIHTHGLPESFKHPDLECVLPINEKLLHRCLSCAIDLIKDGTRFEPGQRYSKILGNGFEVEFMESTESGRPVLRMILPDAQNRTSVDSIDKGYAVQWRA